MVEKARMRFFWPNMRKDILKVANACEACAICGPKQVFEPPVVDAEYIAGLRPMDKIAVDYGTFGGKNFLIIADRASSYAFCEETRGQTTAETIKVLDKIFDFFGPPMVGQMTVQRSKIDSTSSWLTEEYGDRRARRIIVSPMA